MVAMFCLTASLLYADQNLMAPNLTAIAQGAVGMQEQCTGKLHVARLLVLECMSIIWSQLIQPAYWTSADFGFDDEQRDKYLGGYIAAAFYIVGAPAALLFGYLSDTVNRRNLLFAAVLLGMGAGGPVAR